MIELGCSKIWEAVFLPLITDKLHHEAFRINHAKPLDSLVGSILPKDSFSSMLLTQCLLARIEATNDVLRSLAHVTSDAALEAAHQADERRQAGRALGPLDGMPMVIKDNVDIAGTQTAAGTLTRGAIVAE